MPRLVGKQSNTSAYVGAVLVLALVGAGCLEYFGTINLVPGFGLEPQVEKNPELPSQSRFRRDFADG
jgi:hypothetical protein